MHMKKTSQKVKTNEILKACALFVICTRVTALHSSYMRMHQFSANQKRAIFFMYIINPIKPKAKQQQTTLEKDWDKPAALLKWRVDAWGIQGLPVCFARPLIK